MNIVALYVSTVLPYTAVYYNDYVSIKTSLHSQAVSLSADSVDDS